MVTLGRNRIRKQEGRRKEKPSRGEGLSLVVHTRVIPTTPEVDIRRIKV
jgi:hypothetical protein